MAFYDYYKILGVPATAGANAIKSAYKQLALKYHPDRNPGNTEAEEVFKLIANAYSVLSDPLKKAGYDRQLRLHTLQVPRTVNVKKSTPANDRKYGPSGRFFKSKKQVVAEQIAWYERRVAHYSFAARLLVTGLFAAGGWLLVFRNWFFDIAGTAPAIIFAGVLVFIIGCGAFFNNLYLEWEYRCNRGMHSFDFAGRAVTGCVCTIAAGVLLMWGASELRFRYHLQHFATLATGEVYEVHGTRVYYRFSTHNDTVNKWENVEPDAAEQLQKQHYVTVEYSSENPNIARIAAGR